MSLLGRYLLGRFGKAFLFCLALVSLLIFLADAFDRLNMLLRETSAPFPILLEYLWLNVPEWAVKAVPVATLLATLYVTSDFIRSGEWLAAQAAGFKPSELARPFFLGAALVTAATFCAQETVLPRARDRAETLYERRIYQDSSVKTLGERRDVIIAPDPGVFVMARVLDVAGGRMEGVVMDEYQDGRLLRQWDARAARWDPRTAFWVFENGTRRDFGAEDQPLGEKDFSSAVSDLRARPAELSPHDWDPDSMSLRELLRHIRRLKRLGADDEKARTDFHLKLAYPFSNLVMCALAIPFAFRARRSGLTAHLAAALGLAFAFWCVLLIGQALGEAGILPGVAAAWAANVVFGALAAALYATGEGLGA